MREGKREVGREGGVQGVGSKGGRRRDMRSKEANNWVYSKHHVPKLFLFLGLLCELGNEAPYLHVLT